MSVKLDEVKMIFTQDEDSAGRAKELGQDLVVRMISAGAEHYFVIETERWAIDKVEDITPLLEYCKSSLEGFEGDGTA